MVPNPKLTELDKRSKNVRGQMNFSSSYRIEIRELIVSDNGRTEFTAIRELKRPLCTCMVQLRDKILTFAVTSSKSHSASTVITKAVFVTIPTMKARVDEALFCF